LTKGKRERPARWETTRSWSSPRSLSRAPSSPLPSLLSPLLSSPLLSSSFLSLCSYYLFYSTHPYPCAPQTLVATPLAALEPPADGKTKVIVIDALDEIKREWLPDALRLITQHLAKLPPWMRIIITSRDEAVIKKALLTTFSPTELKCDEKRNKADVEKFFERVVRKHVAAEDVSPEDLEREVKKKFDG